MNKDLLPGRTCNSSSQCTSMNCQGDTCVGRIVAKSCNSHADCGNKNYCSKSTNPPFLSTCKSMITAYQPCLTDFECQSGLYCWYPNKEGAPDNVRISAPEFTYGNWERKGYTEIITQCLPMYTQPPGKAFGWGWTTEVRDHAKPAVSDFEKNGRHCEHGLAVPRFVDGYWVAECATTKVIKQRDAVLT